MAERWILQFCHGYYGPFLDVARQYAALFRGSDYKVLTVYLTGEPHISVENASASDEVRFLGFHSRDIRGLKLGAIRALKRLAATRNFVFVIAHRFKPIYISCLATDLPVIGVHHAFGGYERPPRRWFVNLFRKRLALLGVSDAVRDDMRRCLTNWPIERIETLHNRLDVGVARAEVLPREIARTTLTLPNEAAVIGNVGRLHRDKDQATLLRAFAKARPLLGPNTLLVIAGKGPLEKQLCDQAQKLGIANDVRFVGQVPDARRLFAAFDLFVLSSDHEPFGMVLLEAMAAGVPVMATNCGGAPEVIGRSDCLFQFGNADELADRLVAFFSPGNESAKRTIVEDGTDRLERLFSDDAARQRFFALPMTRNVLRVS